MELETLSKVVEMASRVAENDAAISISDRRQFIYYQPGKAINLPIRPGEPLREGTASLQTVLSKAHVTKVVDPQVFGIPYYAIGYPIIENDKIEGSITAIFPLQKARPNETAKPAINLLMGRTEDRFLPIKFHDIHWISSKQKKTLIHTNHGTYQNKYTLQHLEEILPKNRFIRCHRSYIVNIESIKEIHPHFHSTFQLVMNDQQGHHIPVSQSYASQFRDILGF
ncbi:LytTR family DNA-binding domain-containing protein [Tuberibacillus calidus]|jgi:hypothetical protein|uniref:LytTR family DNA-binding domain-containing protein n=1 Tax=Tuberibacillus calidus TaxID=340097 RepID=UPI0004215036|nr:LytTR family DNA-binding domain-containing protein [Tuberibacillus calidus]